MSTIVTGQLYRVHITGRSVIAETKVLVANEYLVVGTSIDEVRMKIPYVIDLSIFDYYKIEYVVKDPDRVALVYHVVTPIREDSPDANIERANGTQGVWQKVEAPGQKFIVHATTTCFAKDEKHAVKKLRNRITEFKESVTFACEETYGGDGFAKARDMSMFPKASGIDRRL